MEDKKREVLEAAKRIFAQYGYSKTTMSDIGRAVGLNKASLYYHYKDKLALFKAVVESARLEHGVETDKQLSNSKSYKDKITGFLLREIDFCQSISVMFKYGSDSTDGIARETKAVYYHFLNEDIKIVAQMIQKGVQSGEFVPCDEQYISNTILNTVDAVLNNQCPIDQIDEERAKGYIDIKKHIGTLLDLILNGMRP